MDVLGLHCLGSRVGWQSAFGRMNVRVAFCLAVISIKRQMVDEMEDASVRRERGRSKIPLKCNLDTC